MSRRPSPPPPPPETIIGTDGDDFLPAFVNRAADYSGGLGDDTLQGSALGDTLDGGAGDDVIDDGFRYGTSTAADSLLGGAGDDVIVAESSAAPDVIDGGRGFDVLTLFLTDGNGVGVTANLTMTGRFGMDGPVTLSNGQTIRDIEFATLLSGGGNDQLFTGRLGGIVQGNGGDDSLTGGKAADTLAGGAGNDLLVGRGGDDLLVGDGGDDLLKGGDGDDSLVGVTGADTLIGGAGADVFARPVDLVSVQRILDFDAAEGDRISLGIGPNDDEAILDPFALGNVRVVDGAEGAEVQSRTLRNGPPEFDFTTTLILVGVAAADVPQSAFLI